MRKCFSSTRRAAPLDLPHDEVVLDLVAQGLKPLELALEVTVVVHGKPPGLCRRVARSIFKSAPASAHRDVLPGVRFLPAFGPQDGVLHGVAAIVHVTVPTDVRHVAAKICRCGAQRRQDAVRLYGAPNAVNAFVSAQAERHRAGRHRLGTGGALGVGR
jgi:hypothetical protein